MPYNMEIVSWPQITVTSLRPMYNRLTRQNQFESSRIAANFRFGIIGGHRLWANVVNLPFQFGFLFRSVSFSQFREIIPVLQGTRPHKVTNPQYLKDIHCQIMGFTNEMNSITVYLTNSAGWLYRIESFHFRRIAHHYRWAANFTIDPNWSYCWPAYT